MATRKSDLVAAMQKHTMTPTATVAPAPSRTYREDRTNVTAYFPAEVKRQLKILSADRNQSIQRLLAEAINDFFAKNGKPEIAPLAER